MPHSVNSNPPTQIDLHFEVGDTDAHGILEYELEYEFGAQAYPDLDQLILRETAFQVEVELCVVTSFMTSSLTQDAWLPEDNPVVFLF